LPFNNLTWLVAREDFIIIFLVSSKTVNPSTFQNPDGQVK
jgi:hypothetical protein